MRKKNLKFMPAKYRKKIRNSPKYWGSLFDWMHLYDSLPINHFLRKYLSGKYIINETDYFPF